MGEWFEGKLADVCASIDYGLTASACDEPVGPKFLRITDIVGTSLNWNEVPFVPASETDAQKFKLHNGDIVIARTGATTGESRYVIDPPNAVFASYLVRLKINRKNNPRFISYWLKSPAFRNYLEGVLGDKSAQPNASASTMTRAPIRIPAIVEEQNYIASVLGALDDKIELNRRMNETLEALARAIFKDWFVNFGPTRAKAEGRTPYLAPELWNLFPDALDDKGKPIGWYQSKLGNEISVLETGKRPRGGVAGIPQGIPSVGAESIVRVGEFDFSKTKYVPCEFFTSMRKGHVSDGDVLIYKDGGKPGELRPAVTYVSRQFPFTNFCINEHVFRIRTESLSQPLLYCLLSTDDIFWQMRERATGVAQPGLNQGAVKSIDFTMLDDKRLLSAAAALIDPIIDGCNDNSLHSRTLAQTRDLLLPKLMSGEIRLPEAEKAVEAVI